jgi:Putative peptidoglycan binding domain
MIRPRLLAAVLTVAQCLAGCGSGLGPLAPAASDLRAETVRGDIPVVPEGACWARDETPAVIETITDQIAEDATPESDAGFRIETRQAIVKPRETIWFRTPCTDALTPDVVATLQRALAARGLFASSATGVLDAQTRSAIRAFQTPRGLNSDRLSLAVAQELGVIAADLNLDAAK